MFDAKSDVINGIDVKDVEALAGAIAADPAKGVTRWKVASKWQGGTHNRSTVEGFEMSRRDDGEALQERKQHAHEHHHAGQTAEPAKSNVASRRASVLQSAI